jgi:hypothetical protein
MATTHFQTTTQEDPMQTDSNARQVAVDSAARPVLARSEAVFG